MLTLYSGGVGYPIKNDDYYIRQLASGMDELIFEISIRDAIYPEIVEEASIQDRDQMHYLIKQIDAGDETAKIVAQIDLDDWKADLKLNYTNGSATVANTVRGVLPAGWQVVDRSLKTMLRTVPTSDTAQPYCATPLEILDACTNIYGVRFRFDNKAKTVTVIDPDLFEPLGAFATRELNLKELNYKGKSQGFATRLYAYGKDGMSFADINGGLPYVDDNTYSARVICAYWSDERYTVKADLLSDAKTRLHSMAVPSRSYDCDVIDLASTNPELYAHQNFSLFGVATLIDDAKKTHINHQVVERWEYPHYPIKNKVVLSTLVPKIQNQITQIAQSVSSPISAFAQKQAAAVASATAQITGNNGGYVVMHSSADGGQPDEILVMDTPDIATATKVWRWNKAGLGYSNNGYNGPYGLAMTQDGAIVADFITTGTLNAAEVKVINLIANHVKSVSGDYSMEMWAAMFSLQEKLNKRVRIYTIANGGGGIVQVFKGTHPVNDGGLDDISRYAYVTAESIGVGQKSDGTFTGEIKTGTLQCDKMSLDGGSAQKVYWAWSSTCGGYIASTSPTLK